MKCAYLIAAFLMLAAAAHAAQRDWIRGVGVVWGVSGGQGGIDWQHKAPLLMKRLKQAGVTIIRLGVSWADIERQRGRYDFSDLDRLVDFVRSNGIDIVACFCTTPSWAWGVGQDVIDMFARRGCPHLLGVMPPAREYWADYERFCKVVAEHFRGRIKLYEFWNEPDGMGMPLVIYDEQGRAKDIRWGGDPKLYAQLLRVVYRGLKSGDPDCMVSVGGMDSRPKLDFLQGIYEAGGQPYFDAVSLHPYPKGRDELSWGWVDAIRRLMVEHGDAEKPIWITEWGWNSVPEGQFGVTERRQAELIRQSILAMRQRPFIQISIHHTLNDWRTRESDPKSVIRMGLCDWWLNPKPAYWAWQAAVRMPATINQLRNAGFDRPGCIEGVAAGWTNTDGKPHPEWYALDTQVKRGGWASQRIMFGPGAKPDLTVWQMTPYGSVYEGRRYRASVWCKYEGIRDSWGGLRLAVRFFGEGGKMLEEHRAPLDKLGSADWHLVQVSARAPRGALQAQIVLYLHAESGTVWYDDAYFGLDE